MTYIMFQNTIEFSNFLNQNAVIMHQTASDLLRKLVTINYLYSFLANAYHENNCFLILHEYAFSSGASMQ